MANHHFIHIELSSEDLEQMKSFYGKAFGWKFQDFPEMNYVTFSTGEGGLGGGFNPVSAESPAGTILVYINTDDIQTTKSNIKAAGGRIVMESQVIPTVGEMAIFTDPSGNTLALLQPEPGSPPA